MDPITAYLIGQGLQIGGAALFGGSDGQEREPFTGSADPQNLLSSLVRELGSLQGPLQQRAGQGGSTPSAYAQPLPSFSGGGLPMTIGAPALDPGFLDPSLLRSPGLQMPSAPQPDTSGSEAIQGPPRRRGIGAATAENVGRALGRTAPRGFGAGDPSGGEREEILQSLRLLGGHY